MAGAATPKRYIVRYLGPASEFEKVSRAGDGDQIFSHEVKLTNRHWTSIAYDRFAVAKHEDVLARVATIQATSARQVKGSFYKKLLIKRVGWNMFKELPHQDGIVSVGTTLDVACNTMDESWTATAQRREGIHARPSAAVDHHVGRAVVVLFLPSLTSRARPPPSQSLMPSLAHESLPFNKLSATAASGQS